MERWNFSSPLTEHIRSEFTLVLGPLDIIMWHCGFHLYIKKKNQNTTFMDQTKPKPHLLHLSFSELMSCVRCSLAWLEWKPTASSSPQWLSLDTPAIRICIFWGLTKASARTTPLSSVKHSHVYISHPHFTFALTFDIYIYSFGRLFYPKWLATETESSQSCRGSWQWCERWLIDL